MKKAILTLLLIASAVIVFGQTKKDTVKAKYEYEYFVKVPEAQYQQITQLLNMYKATVIYDPKLSDKEARTLEGELDKYLFTLPKTVKLDSVIKK